MAFGLGSRMTPGGIWFMLYNISRSRGTRDEFATEIGASSKSGLIAT